jgi:hypothetical protein
MRTVAIDPGAVTGIAIADERTLVYAGVSRLVPTFAANNFWEDHRPVLTRTGHGTIVGRGNRLIAQAIEFGRTVQRCYNLAAPMPCDRVIGERPLLTDYRPVNSSADIIVRGNDLIQTAIRLGVYLEACGTTAVKLVFPGLWKGQVPKDIHNRRVLAKLTPEERSLVPQDHNAIDSVGLLLWALGR